MHSSKNLFATLLSNFIKPKYLNSNMASLNVFRKPIQLHSTNPMTGFLRDGYCHVPKSDFGNHSIAAIMTDEFLDFSASKGNDLRTVGLKGGCKWCLCVSRWFEAVQGAQKGELAAGMVPKVVLGATNEKALERVDLDVLKKFAVDQQESS